MLVDVIQCSAFSSIHHVPEQTQPFQRRQAGLYQAVIDGSSKVQCAFQHKTVCLYRYGQIIERTDCGDNPVATHSSGQIEQHHVIMRIRFVFKCPSVRHAVFRVTADNRISPLVQPFRLFNKQTLINGNSLYHLHIPFFLFDD